MITTAPLAGTIWKCQECGNEFGVGDWLCNDGATNHVVESKEYLMDDAPSDPGHAAIGGADALRDGRTRVCNIPPDKTVLRNGETALIPGSYVEFVRGRFSTTNPEIQHYLNKKGGFCNEARWRQVWLSQEQQFELDKMKLAADRQRLENDRNELLSQVKAKSQAKPVTA
jgi:hypothetical protein